MQHSTQFPITFRNRKRNDRRSQKKQTKQTGVASLDKMFLAKNRGDRGKHARKLTSISPRGMKSRSCCMCALDSFHRSTSSSSRKDSSPEHCGPAHVANQIDRTGARTSTKKPPSGSKIVPNFDEEESKMPVVSGNDAHRVSIATS